MTFTIPRFIAPLTETQKNVIHASIQIFDGYLYFHRIPNPTEASVLYSTSYILSLLRETGYNRIIIDFTEREMVAHRLRRLMLSQVADTDLAMTTVAIVLDGNSFRRVIVDFFVRTYLHRRDVDVRLFATKEEAIAYINQSIQLEYIDRQTHHES